MSGMVLSARVRQARSVTVSSFCLTLAILGLAGPSPGQTRTAERVAGKPLFRAGAFASNITPPLGEPIVGNFDTPAATHIHDELHARCLVLDDGKTRLAFAICD